MVKRVIVTILLLPLAEVAAFALVAMLLGFLPALALVALSSMAGIAVLRRARARRADTSQASVGGGLEGRVGDLMAVAAGALLVVPGFITTALGAALLSPPLRRGLWQRIGGWPRPMRPTGPVVVDLAPQEWRQVPLQQSPDERGPRRET